MRTIYKANITAFSVNSSGFPWFGASDWSLWQQQLRSHHRYQHWRTTSHHTDCALTAQVAFSWQRERISRSQQWKHTKVWHFWCFSVDICNGTVIEHQVLSLNLCICFQRERPLIFPKCPERKGQRRVTGESDANQKQISEQSNSYEPFKSGTVWPTDQWYPLRFVVTRVCVSFK